MKALFIIWLILVAILICVRMQVHVQWPAITADAQAPTATPTPVGPNYCTVTGQVVNADGTPLVNGTISFNSTRIQVVGGVVINPTYVSTNTDATGNIRAITLPMGLVVQVTICPPSQGQGQSSNCSAPFQVIVPFTPTGDFGEMAQGTALTSTSTLSLTTLNVSGTLTYPDGSTYTTAGHNNMAALGVGQPAGPGPLSISGSGFQRFYIYPSGTVGLMQNGHLVFNTGNADGTGTVTAPSASNCGGGTVASGSTDNAGFIDPAGGVNSCTVNFGHSLGLGVVCTSTPIASNETVWITGANSNGFTLNCSTACGQLYYICVGVGYTGP